MKQDAPDWVAERTEIDYTVSPSVTAAVSFDYDDRGRLIEETRVEGGSTTKYDLAYTYDQVGNRLTKANAVTDMLTVYVYDVHCTPDAAGDDMEMNTHNNRLLAYRVYDGDDPQTDNLLRTVRYTYYDNGNVANITLKDDYVSGVTSGTEADYDWYHDLMLHYWADGTVRAAMWSRWKLNASGEPINVEFGDAREFHYDSPLGSPRQRFLTIDFDTNDKDDEPNGWTPAEPVAYTDYLGASAYNDGEITYDTQSSTWELTDTMNYLAGQWQKDPNDPNNSEMQYYHGDLVGSTMLTTDGSGDDVSTVCVFSIRRASRFERYSRRRCAQRFPEIPVCRRVRLRVRPDHAERCEPRPPAAHVAASGLALVPARHRPVRPARPNWDSGWDQLLCVLCERSPDRR